MSVLNTKLATGNASDVIIHNIGGATLPSEKLAVLDGDWAEHISEQSKPMTVNEDGNILKAPFSSASAFGLLYNKEVLEKTFPFVFKKICGQLLDHKILSLCETLPFRID